MVFYRWLRFCFVLLETKDWKTSVQSTKKNNSHTSMNKAAPFNGDRKTKPPEYIYSGHFLGNFWKTSVQTSINGKTKTLIHQNISSCKSSCTTYLDRIIKKLQIHKYHVNWFDFLVWLNLILGKLAKAKKNIKKKIFSFFWGI